MKDGLSIVSLIFTIILGIGAVIQSWKYNKTSEKISNDTKYMLIKQIKLLNYIEGILKDEQKNSKVVNMSKDMIHFHKLSLYRKKDADKIMEILNYLSIKKQFLDGIEIFLKSEKQDYCCNFRGKARGDDAIDITEIYSKLLARNLFIEIDFDAGNPYNK